MELILETIKILKDGKHRWIPSSIAFYFIISIIPLTFIFIILAAKTNISNDILIDFLSKNEEFGIFIKNISDYINTTFVNVNFLSLILLLLYSIYLSSNGVVGIILAINSFFDFKSYGFIITRIYALIINFILVALISLIIFFINILPLILNFLKIELSYYFTSILAIPIIYLAIFIIYLLATNFKLKLKDINIGLLFTSISIYLLVLGSTFLVFKSSRDLIYGSFASLIFIVYFIYIIAQCIYIGLALNVASYNLKKGIKS